MQKHKNLSSCESLSKQDVPFASRKSSTVQSSEKSVFLILNLYIPRSGPGGAAGAALDITANWEHRLHRDGDRAAAQLHLPGPDELRHGVATSPAVAPATLLQAPYYPQLFLILSPLHSPGWQGTTHGAEVATQALSLPCLWKCTWKVGARFIPNFPQSCLAQFPMKFLFSSQCKVCYWPECLFKTWLIQLATHPATHLLCHWPSASCYLSDKFNMLSPWCEIPVRVTCKATSVCLLLRATYVLLATLVSGHQQAPFPGQLVDWGMAADSPCWAAMSRKFCLFRLKSSKFQAFLEPTF